MWSALIRPTLVTFTLHSLPFKILICLFGFLAIIGFASCPLPLILFFSHSGPTLGTLTLIWRSLVLITSRLFLLLEPALALLITILLEVLIPSLMRLVTFIGFILSKDDSICKYSEDGAAGRSKEELSVIHCRGVLFTRT